ncbi:hypothetical protein NQ314_008272 [Rhamnusium bicolor]|uniref:PiggyBac transposable element-derived protein domain-containing protein n=1 Tax=Rhamnusium bicolor TaxID=1586634 RepID=A0AAV8YCH2_9CUCU|nr:hypothetical protein NQ314_008272 [Rhamnusium bicolor]
MTERDLSYRDNDTDIDEQWESEENIPLARLQNKKITNKKQKKEKKQRKEEIIWLDDSLNVSQEDNAWTDFQSLPADICEMDQPYQLFSYFFSKHILSYVTEQTNLFSVQVRPEKPANISEDEIKAFVGIYIYMSVIHLPSTRSYWNNIMEIPAVSQTMTCNRFEQIKRFLHFSNNNEQVPFGQNGHDKPLKIRPFLDKEAVFSHAQENEIVQHCKNLDKRFYGLTLKSLLYSYAERNHIRHPFKPGNQLAGRDFTRGFMRRNRLSLRTPRKTSIARTMGFNRIQLVQYFDNLENVLQKYKFLPNRIYNVDESGFQTVPNKLPKHVAPTGKKDVAKAVAAEHGQTVTAVCCMNATDHHVSPYFLPLKAYYESVADSWTTSNPGQVLSIYHVAGLFGTAFAKTATVDIANEGFRATGVYPLNKNIFTDVDFLPAEVTEQDLDTDISDEDRVFVHFEGEVTQEYPLDPSPQQQSASDAAATRTEPSSESVLSTCLLPGPSNVAALPQPLECPNDSKQHVASPSDIIPFPKIIKNRKRTGRSLKSTLLTSTPNKERLMELEEEKEKAAREKERKATLKMLKIKTRNGGVKRKVFEEESSSDDSVALSFQDSNDFCDLFSSADEENDSDSVLPTPRPEDFVLVKVFGKDSYKLFIAKVVKPDNDGYEGVFYKRMPNTFRFCETTEGAFFSKERYRA